MLKIEYGLNLWLKVSFIISTYITKKIMEIPLCAKKVIFITEFTILWKHPPIYEVKKYFLKKALRMEGFQKYFFLAHFF